MKCCLLTDVGTRTNSLTFEPDPDYMLDAGTGLLSSISYRRGNAEFYCVWKIPRVLIGRPSLQRGVVLKWFYSLRAVGTILWEVHALYTDCPSSSSSSSSYYYYYYKPYFIKPAVLLTLMDDEMKVYRDANEAKHYEAKAEAEVEA